jgi:hypothetical protein
MCEFVVWWPPKVTKYFFVFFCSHSICCSELRDNTVWVGPGRVFSPTPLLTSMVTFGWLLCPTNKWWPSKARVCPSLYSIFLLINSLSQMTRKRPPHTFHSSRISSPMPPPVTVDTTVRLVVVSPHQPSSGGPLRLRLHLPLYFLVAAILAPQTREPMLASTNPKARDLRTLVGEQQQDDM